jgi:hypothetical protein
MVQLIKKRRPGPYIRPFIFVFSYKVSGTDGFMPDA